MTRRGALAGMLAAAGARRACAMPPSPPLDLVGPYLAAYGPARLSSQWGGSAFRVQRMSDGATAEIGFANDGLLDTAALSAFSGGAPVLLSVAYDQTGNGHHAAAPRGSEPVLNPRQFVGQTPAWLPSVSYNAAAARLPSANLQYLALPRSLQASASALGVFALLRSFTADMPLAFLTLDAASNGAPGVTFSIDLVQPNPAKGVLLDYFGHRIAASGRPSQNPATWLGCSLGTSSASLIVDDALGTGTPVAAGSGLAGGVLGAGFDPLGGGWRTSYAAWGPAFIAGRTVPTAERNTLRAATEALLGVSQSAPAMLVTWGDSATAGFGATDCLNRSTLLAASLASQTKVVDLGRGGASTTDLLAAYPADLGPLLRRTRGAKVVSLLCGINDVRQGATGAATWNNLARLIALATGGGAQVGVLTFPLAPGSSVGADKQQTTLNDLIRANWRGAGAAYMADVAADPTLIKAFETGDPTYFHPVGTEAAGHPTTAGYQIFARLDSAALIAALPGLTKT